MQKTIVLSDTSNHTRNNFSNYFRSFSRRTSTSSNLNSPGQQQRQGPGQQQRQGPGQQQQNRPYFIKDPNVNDSAQGSSRRKSHSNSRYRPIRKPRPVPVWQLQEKLDKFPFKHHSQLEPKRKQLPNFVDDQASTDLSVFSLPLLPSSNFTPEAKQLLASVQTVNLPSFLQSRRWTSVSTPGGPWPGVWTWSFQRLWDTLRPIRSFSKPFFSYIPFQALTPLPFDFHNNLARMQSRVFAFWYEVSQRCFHVSVDFGIKEKKNIREDSLWFRRGRRHSSIGKVDFWTYLCRSSSALGKIDSNILLNTNLSHPYFPNKFSHTPPKWFEEKLSIVRKLGWNFYGKATTLGVNTSLSHSSFESSILLRRVPLSSNIFWLASPIHDNSVYLSHFLKNNRLLFPETYFQWRRFGGARWARLFSSWAFSFFWKRFSHSTIPSSLVVGFSLPADLIIFKNYCSQRLLHQLFFPFSSVGAFSFPSSLKNLFFLPTTNPVVFRTTLVPLFRTQRRSANRMAKTFQLFPDKSVYLRHLHRRVFRRQWLWTSRKLLHSSPNPVFFQLFSLVFRYPFWSSKFTFYQILRLLETLFRVRSQPLYFRPQVLSPIVPKKLRRQFGRRSRHRKT